MKLETLIIVTKALCVTVVGAAIPYATALAQWADSETGPTPIGWHIIVSGAVVGGAGALGGFLSTAFGSYLKSRGGPDITNGNAPKP